MIFLGESFSVTNGVGLFVLICGVVLFNVNKYRKMLSGQAKGAPAVAHAHRLICLGLFMTGRVRVLPNSCNHSQLGAAAMRHLPAKAREMALSCGEGKGTLADINPTGCMRGRCGEV